MTAFEAEMKHDNSATFFFPFYGFLSQQQKGPEIVKSRRRIKKKKETN
jgi:hypothetical protein